MQKKKKIQLSLFNFIMLTISGFINAVGIVLFLAPVNLFDSGFSGTAMFLGSITSLPMSVYILVLNLPFFALGFKRQGAAFTVYSIYAVAVYSAVAFLLTDVIGINLSGGSPFAGNDLLLCAVFGGLISGVGSGLTIRFGGAIDGVEVMSVIFAKRIGITVGTFVMIYNVILYIIIGIVCNSWVLPMYSIVTYTVAIKAVDFIVEGLDKAKAAMIITFKPREICAELSENFGSGITLMKGEGYYSGQEKTIVYFVVNRFQIGKLKTIVSSVDPGAYVTITEVSDVMRSIVKKSDIKPSSAAETEEASAENENTEAIIKTNTLSENTSENSSSKEAPEPVK
ncbi:MAG: YitT family protein [Oscillospiraceae bacterium]|nr:YitT family protein [Oscillospiraceae bacterium]